MAERKQALPAESGPGYAEISPSGRVGLLDVAFSRIIYGFGAMIIVGLPFSIWFFFLGKNPLGLLLWVSSYLLSLPLLRRLYRHRKHLILNCCSVAGRQGSTYWPCTTVAPCLCQRY